ncbi:hypothetical protein F5X68DRAFT_233705 [Plectosphaerella plurivora]|uniref:Uncharacterized protein n=1 Tax=Plectosphaerella plurivora TaxID=936078 RepID=A0A9P8V6E5_9PEZI|nr:hypothetical protein F5X68DRAFT_233705 [Plectosphaerella plurivora]
MPALTTPVRSTAQKLQAALPATASASATLQRSQPAVPFPRPAPNRQMTVYSTSTASQRRARLEEYHRRMANVM